MRHRSCRRRVDGAYVYESKNPVYRFFAGVLARSRSPVASRAGQGLVRLSDQGQGTCAAGPGPRRGRRCKPCASARLHYDLRLPVPPAQDALCNTERKIWIFPCSARLSAPMAVCRSPRPLREPGALLKRWTACCAAARPCCFPRGRAVERLSWRASLSKGRVYIRRAWRRTRASGVSPLRAAPVLERGAACV